MNSVEDIPIHVVRRGDNMPMSVRGELAHSAEKRPSSKLLLVAGLLGMTCGGFLILEPHVGGAFSVIGALLAGAASVVATYLARKTT